ncbi:uncharacterized protein TNCT_347381 [Trichonephila clavata]|uniref:Uncharacterized protein n=1 Tax=Trichonephila clavata TaxID=2740835 RepID=A0A8X6KCV8_TRICU|nr:uncharacterized protein TNCT_347381 [Trichonephila clavata]
MIALEDVDICELEAELNVFKGKVDRLENTHSNILELLSEKDYDAEFEIVEDFRDKAIRIETKAIRIINGQQNVSNVLNSTNDVSVAMNSVRNVVIDKNKFKLPKLELRKLDGFVIIHQQERTVAIPCVAAEDTEHSQQKHSADVNVNTTGAVM